MYGKTPTFSGRCHFYSYFQNPSESSGIKDFLDNRKQTVVINGINSDKVPVSSGVPQGSVLGPILFLAYINDLLEQVKSRVRLFADDTAMYLAISSTKEGQVLRTYKPTWHVSNNGKRCGICNLILLNARSSTLPEKLNP